MSLALLFYSDPRLAQKSSEITVFDQELENLAAEMFDKMYASAGVGLAAPQVGHFIRLVVIDPRDEEDKKEQIILVNPSYEPVGTDKIKGEEGCLSVKDYRDNVSRWKKISVTAQDIKGNPISFEAEEFLAVIIQHELDHLEGKLFINHLSHLKKSLYDKKLKKIMAE